MKKKKVCVVIPAYREKDNLVDLVPAIFSQYKDVWVVVVNDDSGDGTDKLIRRLAKKYKKLELLHRDSKDGRGSAAMAGMKLAVEKLKVEVVVEMDADFSHRPSELAGLVDKVDKKKVAMASRYIKGSKLVGWPVFRKVTSWMANRLIKVMLNLPMKDNTNGYRAYSKEACKVLMDHKFETKGYILLSEAAYLLTKRGFEFEELSTVFANRVKGVSNTTWRELWAAFKGVWVIRQNVG